MSERFIEFEHGPGEELVIRLKLPRAKSLPADARDHARAAIKEGLLTIRSLFDAAIEDIERAEQEAEGRTKIEVE